MVVGTTGWYDHIPEVRKWVEQAGTGFIFASNFSVGINVFFKAIAAASAALKHGYHGDILERHHIHKKDAPSGTAVTMRQHRGASLRQAAGNPFGARRRGVRLPQLTLQSAADTIVLTHDATSRRGLPKERYWQPSGYAARRDFTSSRISSISSEISDCHCGRDCATRTNPMTVSEASSGSNFPSRGRAPRPAHSFGLTWAISQVSAEQHGAEPGAPSSKLTHYPDAIWLPLTCPAP